MQFILQRGVYSWVRLGFILSNFFKGKIYCNHVFYVKPAHAPNVFDLIRQCKEVW